MDPINQCYNLESCMLPDLHGKSEILEQKHVNELSKHLPARAEGCSWTLAFTTSTMGYSLPSLYRSLSGYDGPVLLIVKDKDRNVFGAFSSCSLKPSESFYGTGETYLFTFKQQATEVVPSSSVTNTVSDDGSLTNQNITKNNNNNNNNFSEFRRFTWTGANLYFIKGNTDSLAFGAGEGNFGLWLDEDLYHGSSHRCKTFNNEPLTSRQDFVVCTLECWCFL